MAETRLEIQIDATGNASAEIAQVSDALSGLGDQVGQLAAGAQMAALRDVGSAAADAFRGLATVGGEWIGKAADAELVSAKLDAQIKAMGGTAAVSRDEMNQLADALSKTTMFEDEAVLSAEGILLRFGNINKETFPQAIKLSADLATMMGSDIPSAAQTLGMALEDPVGALGRLRRAGILFTQAQEEQIKAMVKVGNTAGAQRVILDTLQSKIGGVAEAAGGTFAGKMAIAQTAADNFRESVGQGLINAFTSLPLPIQTTALVLQQFAGNAVTVIAPLVQMAGALAQLSAAGGFTALATGLSAAGTAASAAATGLWAAVAPMIVAAGPVLALVAALGLLVWVWSEMGDKATIAAQQLVSIIGILAIQAYERAREVGTNIVRGIGDGLRDGWNWLGQQVQGLVNFILGSAQNAAQVHSPSQLFADKIGAPMAQGVAMGFTQAAPAMAASMGGAITAAPREIAGGGRGGFGGAGVTVVYSPTFSAATQKEFETLLVPIIDRQLSLNQRRRV